jgi:hypothetical protein
LFCLYPLRLSKSTTYLTLLAPVEQKPTRNNINKLSRWCRLSSKQPDTNQK